MKFKGIIYQNFPKKIHGDVGRINLFGLQHDYVFKENNEKTRKN